MNRSRRSADNCRECIFAARRQRSLLSVVLNAACILLLLLGSAQPLCAGAPEIRIVTTAKGEPVAFEAIGIPRAVLVRVEKLPADDAHWPRLFSIGVLEKTRTAERPAMLGTYTVADGVLRFTPRYPLRPGLTYRAELRPGYTFDDDATRQTAAPGKAVTRDVTIAEPAGRKPTVVTQVYPSSSELPENQLKFYLHFSAPMSRREAYERVRILKSDGQPVDLPFLELDEELWNGDGTRLTLIIDPGRIKRGVKPLEDLGPALEAGHDFTLVIDASWQDAGGKALALGVQKKFRVGPPVRIAIDPAAWKISAPRAGTSDPLTVRFERPLDHALLERALKLHDETDHPVAGRVLVRDKERRWEFHPTEVWRAGAYQLVIDMVLEDLAGNRIGRPFEVDEADAISKRVSAEFLKIPIRLMSPAAAPQKESRQQAP